VYITWLRLIKNLTPGRKRVRAGIKLFGELQGRVSPEDLNKKFTEIVNIPGMFQVFARLCCQSVRAGRRLCLDDKWSFPLWL
jgi:hypothetical protein